MFFKVTLKYQAAVMWLQLIFMIRLLAKTPKSLLLVGNAFLNFERAHTHAS